MAFNKGDRVKYLTPEGDILEAAVESECNGFVELNDKNFQTTQGELVSVRSDSVFLSDDKEGLVKRLQEEIVIHKEIIKTLENNILKMR